MGGILTVFSQRLQEIRQEKGLKQTDLAQQVGTGYQSISNWENGVSSPKLEMVCALAEALGVSVDYLAGVSDSPKVSKPRKKAP